MSTRRGHGEGGIRQRLDGRWEATIDEGIGLDGKRRRRYLYGRTRAEVLTKLRTEQRQADAGVKASTERLAAFAEWWLTTLEAKAAAGEKSTNTVDNARWAVEKWITPGLGHKRLRELEPEDVEALLARMAAAGRARRSIVRVRSYFGQLLTVAERRGKVARNVARIAEMPATKPAAERRALTPEQATKLIETVRGHRLEALFLAGLMVGLRPGELTGLRWADVDLDAGTIRIEKSLKNHREPGTEGKARRVLALGDTKTPRSRRVLELPAPAAEALRAHRTAQKREQLASPVWRDAEGLVFTTPVGSPLDPSNLRHAFADLTEAAGLGRWTTNELRHSAASLLSAAGLPLEVIADNILGHASTRMLEQHYRHQLRPSLGAHVGVMDGLFGSAAEG